MSSASDPSYDPRSALALFAPGVVLTRDLEAALAQQYQTNGFTPLTQAQVLALAQPLIPEGNPPEYTAGPPPAQPILMPGASPVFAAALPPQPSVLVPIDGGANPQLGTVATFAKGLRRFVDSNPDPYDGWAIDNPSIHSDWQG
ncbi:MAG TPA: hypothetical protein VGR70_09905 [Stellaceae bacterium]|nr:hypothetical protein [Stellaceae bacterium]